MTTFSVFALNEESFRNMQGRGGGREVTGEIQWAISQRKLLSTLGQGGKDLCRLYVTCCGTRKRAINKKSFEMRDQEWKYRGVQTSLCGF